MFMSLYTDKAKGILTEQRFLKLTASLEQEQEANRKRLRADIVCLVYRLPFFPGKPVLPGSPDFLITHLEADCLTGAGTGSQSETASGFDAGDAPYRRAGKRRSDIYAGNPQICRNPGTGCFSFLISPINNHYLFNLLN